MPTVYLTEPRSLVKKDGECLLVQVPEDKETGREKRVVRVPLIKIDQVVVAGDVTLTSPALAALLERNVEVCFLGYYGKFWGRLSPSFSKNGLLRIAQHAAHADPPLRLRLASEFVQGKLANQRTMLLRGARTRDDARLAELAEMIRQRLDQVGEVRQGVAVVIEAPPEDGDVVAAEVDAVAGLGALVGLEGAAGAAYFAAYGRLLKTPLGFARRTRRPPTDPVNAMLSYGYTLLMQQAMTAVNIVGMDPYVGFLHSSQYGKPALALDLMEEFRPLVVDSVVLSLINNGMLQGKDFIAELGSVRMTDKGRRTFLEKYEERLNTEVEHPRFGYKATYRRCLELQARLLAKTLKGEIPAYPPFVAR